ncbi:MAG: alanine racemase, partial [Lachnospiraceae bacterium]|nr:alanine racemase [Lachnospiraceae bacterium]
MYQKGRAWIELNMKNLAHNIEQLQSILSDGCEIMPAIKANAYGHGAV